MNSPSMRALLVALLFSTSLAQAAARRDLTAGIVYPSTNTSVVENPGAMNAVGSDKAMIDITAYLDTNFDVFGGHGAYAKAKDYYAYGLFVSNGEVTGSFGLKIKSSFHAGLGVAYDWQNSSYLVPAGIWTSLSGGLKVGAMVNSLPDFNGGAVGIAGSVGSGAILELDMTFYRRTQSIDPSGALFRPAFVYTASKKFSFKASYSFPAFPSFAPGQGEAAFGVSYWISESLGLYAGYNDFTGGYQFGIRAGPK